MSQGTARRKYTKDYKLEAVAWCRQPGMSVARGVTYLVRRRLPGEAAFTLLGVTGTKAFVDEALPAGVECVQYRVQSQRGAKVSPVSATLVVNIGKVAKLAGKPTCGTHLESQNFKTSKSQNVASSPGVRDLVIL